MLTHSLFGWQIRGLSVLSKTPNVTEVSTPSGEVLASFGGRGHDEKAISFAAQANKAYMSGYREALKDLGKTEDDLTQAAS